MRITSTNNRYGRIIMKKRKKRVSASEYTQERSMMVDLINLGMNETTAIRKRLCVVGVRLTWIAPCSALVGDLREI